MGDDARAPDVPQRGRGHQRPDGSDGARRIRNDAGQPLDALVEAIADKLAERIVPHLLEAFGRPSPQVSEPLFVRVAAYAKRTGISERTAWGLVAKGLPTIGSGRSRRVDIVAADAWLRAQGGREVDDAIERRARLDARRKVTGTK
jgi:hypothetical protein